MNAVQRQLMHCIAAYRCNSYIEVLPPDVNDMDWQELYQLASIHKLTAVVFDTMCKLPGFCGDDKKLLTMWKRETMFQAVNQAAKTQRIVHIGQLLEKHKIPYALVKGAMCRNLYAKPDIRVSGDEDLFIAPVDKAKCQLLFEQDGLELIHAAGDEDVVHWKDKQTGLHIELHTKLFSSRRAEDRMLNQLFAEQLNHTVAVSLAGGVIRTFHPTYHFVFLVCHAMKHFLTGGFGVRTICDVVTFAEKYSDEIHHQTAYVLLERVNGRKFLDQLFAVGHTWLSFDLNKHGWCYSEAPDADELLEDSLDAGIYGHSTMSRRHSAGIVLQAVEKNDQNAGTLSSIFPNRQRMEGKYPVLKKRPVLLPVCWAHRIGKYSIELLRSKKGDNSPLESVVLGKKRTEMMVKYGILPKNQKKN